MAVDTLLMPLPSLLLQKLLGNSLLKLEGDDRLDINCTLPLTDQVRHPVDHAPFSSRVQEAWLAADV